MNLNRTLLLLTFPPLFQALPAQSIETVTTSQDPVNPTNYHLEWPAYQGYTYYLQTSFNLINWTTDPNYFIGTSMLENLTIQNLTPDPTFFARIISYTGGPNDDNDSDGLPNHHETTVTHTNPDNPDSDGDGVTDAEEVAAGTNPNDPESGPAYILEIAYPEDPPDQHFFDENLNLLGSRNVNTTAHLGDLFDHSSWWLQMTGIDSPITAQVSYRRTQAAPETRTLTLINHRGPESWWTDPPPELFGINMLDLEIPTNQTHSPNQPTLNTPLPTYSGGQWSLLPVEVRDIKDSNNTADDVTITPWDTATQTNPTDANIAWIEPHKSATDAAPRMPQLELKISGLPATMTIQAKIEVQYNRGNGARATRNQAEDRVRIPADGSFHTVTGDTWEIWEAYAAETFFGGEATLTYKLMTGTTETLAPQIIRFRIGGKNPDDARCRTYIESRPNAGPGGNLWFAYAIAKSESRDYNGGGSRFNQFLELPHHPRDVGRPLWGNDGGTSPGGYGMFQVTGNVANPTANIPRSEMWNWRENVHAGLRILASKRTTADAWMTQQKNAQNSNGTALPNHTVRGVTFSEGTNRTMNDAVTFKLYNGASRPPAGTDNGNVPGFLLDNGSGHYCFWRNASNQWALNRFNNPPAPIQPFNYVDRVCQEVEN